MYYFLYNKLYKYDTFNLTQHTRFTFPRISWLKYDGSWEISNCDGVRSNWSLHMELFKSFQTGGYRLSIYNF